MQTLTHADPLVVAGVAMRSRLFLGTGKYTTDEAMLAALEASGCELVTVALRRLDLDDPKKKTILDVIDWHRYRILPNTAGCRTAEEAIRIARLARSRRRASSSAKASKSCPTSTPTLCWRGSWRRWGP